MSSTVSVNSSLPRTNFRGIKDESAVNLSTPVERLPIRLPLFFSFAPWGEVGKARYVDSAMLQKFYGAEITNPMSKFWTHQSQFIRSTAEAGGKFLFLRLLPSGAEQASARLQLDVLKTQIPVYERNLDGTYALDQSGNKIPTGETVEGHRLQWRMVAIPTVASDPNAYLNGFDEVGQIIDKVSTFGQGVKTVGHLVDATSGETSTLIPVSDILARFYGEKGRLYGFRMSAPTVRSTDPADPEYMEELGSFLYRFQAVVRPSTASSGVIRRTLSSDAYVDFSFKRGAVDIKRSIDYYAPNRVPQSYESKDLTKFVDFSPFEKMHVYDTYLNELLTDIVAAETAYTGDTIADKHLINLLTGVDANGVPYHTFVVEGPAQGGLVFNESASHFMIGGADGQMGPEAYNTQVSDMLDTLAENPVPFGDIARMPYDSVWDSGFPVDVKLKFANFHNLRPDVIPHVCTQDVSEPLNSRSKDSSVAVTLRSHFRSMQESSEFATKATRFFLMGNAGYLIDDLNQNLVPFLEDLCIRSVSYMGAEDGSMTNAEIFGRGEDNVIVRYRDHNGGGGQPGDKNLDWQNGLNFTEWFDMSRVFWPSLQSIYEDHTSILHSYLNVCIACNLTRIGHIVWRELAGDDRLTDEEFLDEVVKKVTEKTTGKYDGRVIVTPNAYYTQADEARGFSWHLDIEMQGDNIRGVQNLAIISQRRRNEEAA